METCHKAHSRVYEAFRDFSHLVGHDLKAPLRNIKADGESHGVGLNIVKRLVEMMAGTLSVSSEPGVGSEIAFVLPAM